MSEENYKKAINEFNNFKQILIKQIKGNFIENECYIINEIWNNDLENCFN